MKFSAFVLCVVVMLVAGIATGHFMTINQIAWSLGSGVAFIFAAWGLLAGVYIEKKKGKETKTNKETMD